ncbi:glycerate kinase [Agromyces silvae]|uniref:glycerate kinase n=1 Tax=Agromyces silvae TaxID=3388266 RepID=UPI00280B3B7E|nr:glycerate kinase [Agromyces protaetiae]
MSRIVIAPDSFKGTIDAADAAAALARGWAAERPGDETVLRPMADGGEGTLDAFEASVPGAERRSITVSGPVDGDPPVETSWVRLPDGTGVVELAATSGLDLVDPLRPLDAHTGGFGEAIVAALDAGVTRLLVGLGGSASSDGGVAALAVLGARFSDASGQPISHGNRGLADLVDVQLDDLRTRPPRGVLIVGDVTNPLLGEYGAAAVFGPQKGADSALVSIIETNLARLARLMPEGGPLAGAAGAGAAGGTGFGLLAWGAEMGAGAKLVADAVGLADAIAGADLVITGEGRFDGQSEAGKAPTEVARIARDADVPVALAAGAITAEPASFVASVSLTDLAGGGAAAMADPSRWLEEAGRALARQASPA